MLTVFTPAYNREKTLKRLYNSLLKQDYKDFEWLVIDDGSTDNTKELINKYIDKKNIKIRYVYKENGGKMSAVNMANDIAKGEWMLPLDSDDYLMPDALKNIFASTKKVKDKRVAGIIFLDCHHENNSEVVGDLNPENVKIHYSDLKYKYHVKGDRSGVWRTSVLRDYHYPLIEGEKFVPDAWLMNEIGKKYYVVTENIIIACIDYQVGGLSDGYFNLVKRNPKGTCLYYLQCYEFEPTFYNVYAYLLFADFAHYSFKKSLSDHPAKVKVCLLYLPVLLISLIRR